MVIWHSIDALLATLMTCLRNWNLLKIYKTIVQKHNLTFFQSFGILNVCQAQEHEYSIKKWATELV